MPREALLLPQLMHHHQRLQPESYLLLIIATHNHHAEICHLPPMLREAVLKIDVKLSLGEQYFEHLNAIVRTRTIMEQSPEKSLFAIQRPCEAPHKSSTVYFFVVDQSIDHDPHGQFLFVGRTGHDLLENKIGKSLPFKHQREQVDSHPPCDMLEYLQKSRP